MSTHVNKLNAAAAAPKSFPVDRPILSGRTQRRLFRMTLLISDMTMLAAAFSVAYWVRFSLQIALAPEVVASPYFYARLVLALLPVWLGLFAVFGLYDRRNLLGGTTEYARAFNACTTGMMLVVVATFLQPEFVVARGWLVAAWLLSVWFVCGARFGLRRLAYGLRRRGYFLTPAVIIGANGEAAALRDELDRWESSGLRIVGGLKVPGAKGSHSLGKTGLRSLGDLSDVEDVVRRHGVRELIVAGSSLEGPELLELFERVHGLPDVEIRLSTGLFEVLTTGVQVKTLGSVPLISLNKLRLEPMEKLMKTVMEYALTVIGLAVLAPVLAIVALLVKWDSPGPILHRRRVMGVGGRQFDAFKFRTMHVNGDKILAGQPELLEQLKNDEKLKKDPRVTRLGRWLRRCSLDELPQLLNVLLGQMSLVGPRMISPGEAEKYGRLKCNLLTVKPGITGLWQVSGRSDLSYDERVRLDMHYIRNYSIWLDLQILFIYTASAVIRGRGAY